VKAPDATAKVVATADGAVRGVASGVGQAFLGIPFAVPPIGARRFAPPAPTIAWQRVRDATKLGPSCPQSRLPGPRSRSEDCLTLNVYAPHDVVGSQRLPVMVWLYGGGLSGGGNGQYDPSGLAERQHVIVVTPNYRVGAFGYLAHPALAGAGEGNYGVLDQQAALRWVQTNIAAFGGDAGNVTLFGESAGSLSTCVQLALPGAKRLFRRAILQSDTCVIPDTTLPMADARAGGEAMARDLGCADAATALACLRHLPAGRIVAAKSHRRGNGGKDGWAPMTGGDVLPRSPKEIFAAGDGANVPLLVGSNHDEGRLFADLLAFTLAMSTRGGYEKAVARALPGNIAPVLARYEDVAKDSYYRAFADIVTDSHFACPVLTLHRLLGKQAPFRAYEFVDLDAPLSLPRAPFTPKTGAYHASEIVYVFQRRWALADPAKFDSAQRALSDSMQDAWGAFARVGEPIAPGGARWPAFDGQGPQLLTPDQRGAATDFAERHRCDFWKDRGF
ncbi:MAG: carboxylesterase family protein, partial [Alphaproteobacteria bacterium]